ncbi:MAG: hypothetical protein IJ565_02615 [Bacilli bacterium]|nr:hypothetical protein [Bacilli bacterium]
MNKKSPNVIFKSKYLLALNSVDNKFQSSNYRSEREKDINDMVNYFSNEKKSLVGMFEYYMGHTRNEHINLVLENGNYATKEDVKKIKTDYKKYIEKSNLWKGILSFKREYLDENIDIKTLEQKIAKEVMPQFLKYCGFKDIKNMSYVFSVHTNRKHQPHIHFAFIEKKPNYIYSNNKVDYRRKGKITLDEQRYLKRLVELTIEREKYYTPLLKKTNEDIDYLKTYFNPKERNFALRNVDEIYIEEKILRLGELLKEYRNNNKQYFGRIKYNSIKNNKLGKEIKSLTKDIKKYLFNDETSILYNCKKDVDKDLNRLNDYFNELNLKNNVKATIDKNSIVEEKGEYINNYIYNSIVNHSLYRYETISQFVKDKTMSDKITVEDLIQEIAYQNSLYRKYTDDKDIRKSILDNYFKGKNNLLMFPSKSKMEKAIRNINYEMDKASSEFSRLFNYDNQKTRN